MPNRAEQLEQIFRALVEDSVDLLELDSESLVRDCNDLATVLSSRGESVLFLTLPELCSDLEYSLESGKYCRRAQGPLTAMKGNLPRFLHPIYLLIFTEDGELLSEPDPEAVRVLRQCFRAFKKYDVPCPSDAKERAINAFTSIELEIPKPGLTWGDTDLRVSTRFPSLVDLVSDSLRSHRVRAILDTEFEGWDEHALIRDASTTQILCDRVLKGFGRGLRGFKPKHGPGAVSEKYRTSKFEFPSWNRRLEKFFPYSEWGIPNYGFGLNAENEDCECGRISPTNTDSDPASKLIAVPKDYKGPRLIASEPIAGQYVQQGLMGMIREQIKQSVLRHSITIEDQGPSKALALEASQSKSFSTIDLSSASDRLSCAVVECVFRSSYSFMEILNAARTPYIETPSGTLAVKKFAAQGAAFTFPVQSIVYALVCAGVILQDNPRLRLSDVFRKVRVYGDDMIVPVDLHTRICVLLTAIYLRVNSGKSFSKGSFRESCGMDAFEGHDVTPAYVRTVYSPRQPASLESVVECSNNLYLKGFIKASSALLDSIPWETRKWIPYVPVGSTALGIVGPNLYARKRRYNRDLQRFEFKCLVVENKVLKTRLCGHHQLMQWFIENPRPDSVWKAGEVSDVKARHRLRWVPLEN